MPKEAQIVTEGTVTQVLPGTMFRVDLPGPRNVLAHISGKMRKTFHPDRARRQSRGGTVALRPDQGAHHFPREISGISLPHENLVRMRLSYAIIVSARVPSVPYTQGG